MSATNDEENVVVTLQNLVATSNGDIVGAALRDLRKVLHDGPEPFSLKAEGPRNEVLAAVLDLRHSLLNTNQPQSEDQKNFAKLFDMSTEDLLRIAGSARPNLVRLMQSALRYDNSLSPRTFDASEQSSVLSVVLKWKLDATNNALQESLNMGPSANEPTPPSSLPQVPQISQGIRASNEAQPPNEEPPRESQQPRSVDNPFAQVSQPDNQQGGDILSLLQTAAPQKRASNMLTLQDINGGKRVRFTTLGQMSLANNESSSEGVNQDFRRGGSPAGQLPPYLMGEYVGRYSTKLCLRVFDFKGGEILAGLLQEGTTIEAAIRNRHWKRSASGEPYQTEQEAATLSRVIHLTLMSFATVENTLSMAPWLETCLRRLFAILYVEEHAQSAQRATLWRVASKMLETQVESTLQVPSMTRLMAQNAALFSKEQSALVSLSKQREDSNRMETTGNARENLQAIRRGKKKCENEVFPPHSCL